MKQCPNSTDSDLTPETVLELSKHKLTVYVAGPYTIGDQEQNVHNMIDYGQQLLTAGLMPFLPLTSHYWHALHPNSYETWMLWCLTWVRRCDALLRTPGVSSGSDREAALAESLGIPVFYKLEDLLVWAENGRN